MSNSYDQTGRPSPVMNPWTSFDNMFASPQLASFVAPQPACYFPIDPTAPLGSLENPYLASSAPPSPPLMFESDAHLEFPTAWDGHPSSPQQREQLLSRSPSPMQEGSPVALKVNWGPPGSPQQTSQRLSWSTSTAGEQSPLGFHVAWDGPSGPRQIHQPLSRLPLPIEQHSRHVHFRHADPADAASSIAAAPRVTPAARSHEKNNSPSYLHESLPPNRHSHRSSPPPHHPRSGIPSISSPEPYTEAAICMICNRMPAAVEQSAMWFCENCWNDAFEAQQRRSQLEATYKNSSRVHAGRDSQGEAMDRESRRLPEQTSKWESTERESWRIQERQEHRGAVERESRRTQGPREPRRRAFERVVHRRRPGGERRAGPGGVIYRDI